MSIKLTVSWLRDQGIADPDVVMRSWQTWLDNPRRRRTHRAELHMALQMLTGLSRDSIRNYFLGHKKLGAETCRRLDELVIALGERLPGGRRDAHDVDRQRQNPVRLASLLDLRSPPSPRFHLESLDALITACEAYNFSVSLHQWRRAAGGGPIRRILASARPQALIWFRATPTRDDLSMLSRHAGNTPAIVIYGARLRYDSPPALMHVFPSQTRIRQDIAAWAARLREAMGAGNVVIAHMPREDESHDLPRSFKWPPSVRNERIDLIREGIQDAGMSAVMREVPDYSASRGLKLVQESKDARGFVCLADELCLGVLHQLQNRGERMPTRRLVGFDDSAHSREFGICSFSQHLPQIGQRVAETLVDFFRLRKHDTEWPPFREEPVPVELILR